MVDVVTHEPIHQCVMKHGLGNKNLLANLQYTQQTVQL